MGLGTVPCCLNELLIKLPFVFRGFNGLGIDLCFSEASNGRLRKTDIRFRKDAKKIIHCVFSVLQLPQRRFSYSLETQIMNTNYVQLSTSIISQLIFEYIFFLFSHCSFLLFIICWLRFYIFFVLVQSQELVSQIKIRSFLSWCTQCWYSKQWVITGEINVKNSLLKRSIFHLCG